MAEEPCETSDGYQKLSLHLIVIAYRGLSRPGVKRALLDRFGLNALVLNECGVSTKKQRPLDVPMAFGALKNAFALTVEDLQLRLRSDWFSQCSGLVDSPYGRC